VLISWKPYLDAGVLQETSPREEYIELVAGIRSGAETLSTRGVEDGQLQNADACRQRLALAATHAEFREAHRAVISSFQSYFEDVAGFIDSREIEIKEIVSLIGDEVADIASESQEHHSRLTAFTRVLQRVGQSRDLPEMRRRLNDEVAQIRLYVDRMHEANRAKIKSLEQQLHTLQSRLERTEEAAHTDTLTGLLNRRAGEQRLGQMLAAGAPFCALLLDLNRFKRINDRFGHSCGDQVLKVTGERLAKAASTAAAVCRWGGDEFLVLFEGDLQTGRDFGDALQRAISGAHTYTAGGHSIDVHIGVSIGVAGRQPDDTDRDLLSRADADLYAQKQHLESKR
jgi:diguanylate cyclase (GGDEF)-like protein